MPNCSNCGRSVEDKPKVCPHCGSPTRIDSPGIFGSHGLGCLIAVALGVGIVAVILLPVFASARSAAKKAHVMTSCKRVAIAMQGYLTDNDDRYPPMESSVAVEQRFDRYLEKPVEEGLREFATKCTWNTAIATIPVSAIDSTSDVWMFYSERSTDYVSCAIAFLDTHVKSANPYVFDKAMARKPEIDRSYLHPQGKTK